LNMEGKFEEDLSDKNCLRCGRFLKKSELIDGLCESCYEEMAKKA
jgi:NMD protein affecting ribosome stability and mRNA decay